MLILFAIIDFGGVYNSLLTIRDGVRETARAGAITLGSFNNAAPTCSLSGASGSNDVQDLMCLAKTQSSVGNTLRVKVMFDNSTLTASGSTYSVGNAIVVCTMYPLSSTTGMFSSLLVGRYEDDKAAYRIEQLPTDSQTETAGSETDPSGGNWSWCQS